jgi:hypothetical protein
MDKLKKIETIVTTLSKTDLTVFREWFSEFDAKIWDEQFEEDVISGKLNTLGEAAIQQFKAGHCKTL